MGRFFIMHKIVKIVSCIYNNENEKDKFKIVMLLVRSLSFSRV